MLAGEPTAALETILRAIRHIDRYSATDTRRGRPSPFKRQDLLLIRSLLENILQRETSGRISPGSFIDHYLRIPHFPPDVIEALLSNHINLFEAEQLSRIRPESVDLSKTQAQKLRRQLLSAHIQARLSGSLLRQRINEVIKKSANPDQTDQTTAPAPLNQTDPLEDFDPQDPSHLFWEEIKQLGFAFREIGREDVTNQDIEELIKASEPVWNVLLKIQRRKQQKASQKLTV